MAGLIDSNMNTPLQDVPDVGQMQVANVTGYDAKQRSIDAAKETVSGQLDSLMKLDSPLMQRAEAGAVQTANRRGLVNSSMAAGAGQAAMIDAAMPIATADANIYGQASRDNQSADNNALQFTAGSRNTGSQFNAGQANQLTSVGLQGEQQRTTQAAGAAQQAALSAQEATQQTGLVGVQGEQQRQTQAAGAAQAATLQTQQAAIQSGLSAQQAEQARTLQAQTALSDQQIQQMRGDQAAAIENIDAQFKTLIQSSASASTFYSNIVAQLGKILDNPNTDAATKQSSVDQITSSLQNGLAVIGGIANLDLTGLLTFAPATPAAP